MIVLNQNRERIKNGTTLILMSGAKVTVVNDRGYQLSIQYVGSKSPLMFITPDEIHSKTPDEIQSNFSETEHNVSINLSSKTEPELITTDASITSIDDLSDS